jgi:hypothetical protein
MNATQKKFILRKLIPFISQEHGRGFAMSTWVNRSNGPGDLLEEDSVERRVPKCGIVACIGGSIQLLAKRNTGVRGAAKILGLTEKQTDALFHRWENGDEIDFDGSLRTAWPEKFRRAFANARTAYGKAMVAVRLLKEVVKTEGACLNSGN